MSETVRRSVSELPHREIQGIEDNRMEDILKNANVLDEREQNAN